MMKQGLTWVLVCLCISACGGGGADSGGATTPPQPPPHRRPLLLRPGARRWRPLAMPVQGLRFALVRPMSWQMINLCVERPAAAACLMRWSQKPPCKSLSPAPPCSLWTAKVTSTACSTGMEILSLNQLPVGTQRFWPL